MDKRVVEVLKLNPRVGLGIHSSTECRWPYQHMVVKRPGGSLGFGVNPVADRPTLHKDDGVMPVLARHGG